MNNPFRTMANGADAIKDAAERAARAWEDDDKDGCLDYLDSIANDCKTLQRIASETICNLGINKANPDGERSAAHA